MKRNNYGAQFFRTRFMIIKGHVRMRQWTDFCNLSNLSECYYFRVATWLNANRFANIKSEQFLKPQCWPWVFISESWTSCPKFSFIFFFTKICLLITLNLNDLNILMTFDNIWLVSDSYIYVAKDLTLKLGFYYIFFALIINIFDTNLPYVLLFIRTYIKAITCK